MVSFPTIMSTSEEAFYKYMERRHIIVVLGSILTELKAGR
jgi:hypothetical protein